jgi:hypothetical protein
LRRQSIVWLLVGLFALLLITVLDHSDLQDTQSPPPTPEPRPGPPDIEAELQRAADLQQEAERQANAQRQRDREPQQATERAWVLWNRTQDASHRERWEDWTSGGNAFTTFSQCWAKIREHTDVAEEGSLADWYQWARGLGRYTKRRDLVAAESGVLVMRSPLASEWRCFPHTVDPRGLKGK